MNVRNCKKCGRIFNYVVGPVICPNCAEEQEAKFQEVKKYVQENPGVDMGQVAKECEVEIAQLRQWIREERLQFSEDSPIRIPCESCGEMIRSGRFCDKCRANMTMGFKDAMGANRKPVQAEQKRPTEDSIRNRMRYL